MLPQAVTTVWRTELGTTLLNGFNSTTAQSAYFHHLCWIPVCNEPPTHAKFLSRMAPPTGHFASKELRRKYIQRHMLRLDLPVRLSAMKVLLELALWDRQFMADLQAAGRAAREERFTAGLEEIGVEKRTCPKRRTIATDMLKLEVTREPGGNLNSFREEGETADQRINGHALHPSGTESVELAASTPAQPAAAKVIQLSAYAVSAGGAQLSGVGEHPAPSEIQFADLLRFEKPAEARSLNSLDNTDKDETAAAPNPAPEAALAAADWQVILAMLRRYGETDRRGAERLLAAYKVGEGGATIQEVLEIIREKARRLDRHKRNPMGWLLGVVSAAAETYFANREENRRRDAEKAARQTEHVNLMELRLGYDQFCNQQVDAAIEGYSPEDLEQALQPHLKALKTNQPDWHARVPERTRREVAMSKFRCEVRERLRLPSFEDWRSKGAS